MSDNLRSRVIKLAYETPALRPVLLPLLAKTAGTPPTPAQLAIVSSFAKKIETGLERAIPFSSVTVKSNVGDYLKVINIEFMSGARATIFVTATQATFQRDQSPDAMYKVNIPPKTIPFDANPRTAPTDMYRFAIRLLSDWASS
jgi:hypothetical protein